ncbi:energy transducer TonB [Kordia sp. YSTF-M3]|uniref:Energy transducer TonB n=1 Tax=Kordia aestuariivivens TaxID=2759037 RepID=A0ABR7QAT0_9FLAO|nr:energy transducer TonB [Kordia aestuariivivens]MBC8755682.1 energy transducer TonB [Kordia aestuariivivens]
MSLFNTEHKRKSATITTALMIVLLLLMFVFGMKYMDPPIESGIAVNFGNTDVGSGNSVAKDTPKPKTTPTETQEEESQETEAVPEEQPETTPEEVESEEVVTQESEESIAIKKAEEAKKKADKEAEEAKAEADRIAKEKQEAEEKAQKERDKKKAELDAMMDGVNNSDGKDVEGEGPDDGDGNKGKPDGDPYAASYYGKPGSGTGGEGGSGLNGRTRLYKPDVESNCKSEGRVVIEITVDKQGKVVKVKQGVGTTAIDKCLIDLAKEAAFKFKWNPDDKAPENQYGVIEFNFSLGG